MANKQIVRTPPPPDPELLERFLSLQEAELAARNEAMRIRELEITKSHEFSKEGLSAQTTDRQNERLAKQTSDNYRYIFLGLIAFAILGFLVFALMYNKDVIALEIIKAAAFAIAGYFGGKYHQKSKDEKPKNE